MSILPGFVISISSLLNKTSLEYLNYKNIKQICEKINIYDNSNGFIYISNIICNYIFVEKNYKNLLEILNYYKLGIDEIDKIVKICLIDYKDSYNSKIKKELKNLII